MGWSALGVSVTGEGPVAGDDVTVMGLFARARTWSINVESAKRSC